MDLSAFTSFSSADEPSIQPPRHQPSPGFCVLTIVYAFVVVWFGHSADVARSEGVMFVEGSAAASERKMHRGPQGKSWVESNKPSLWLTQLGSTGGHWMVADKQADTAHFALYCAHCTQRKGDPNRTNWNLHTSIDLTGLTLHRHLTLPYKSVFWHEAGWSLHILYWCLEVNTWYFAINLEHNLYLHRKVHDLHYSIQTVVSWGNYSLRLRFLTLSLVWRPSMQLLAALQCAQL